MRKVLLTVMMVSSLLAFNACKKDGATGPAGPAGPTGATGAAGPAGAVGAAGAKGADGTKILTGTAVPNAEGVVGDYYLQKSGTTTVLWGPKVAAGWAGTNVTLNGAAGATGATGATGADGATGATGATGAVGAAGTQFLAGAGAPADGTGVNGDFYFDTTNSVFYGPKMAGTWTGTNTMSLGTAFAPKRYTILRGFENVVEKTTGAPAVSVREYGQDLIETWGNFDINTSYAVTANDMIRINQYPGWGDNREMIFQADPVGAPGIYNSVPNGPLALGVFPFDVGAKFRYTRNTTNTMAEFTLTQADIDRLQDNGGLAYGYLTYAKAQPSTVALGQNLVFARTKNVQVKNSTTNFATQYTALTKFNLNSIANFDKYRQEGKVYVKYKYYTRKAGAAAVNNVPVLHNSVGGAGWIDLTQYANSYVGLTGATTPNYGTPGVTDANPFTLDPLANNFMTSGSALGTAAVVVPLATNQSATAVTVVGGTNPTTYDRGNVIINWDITSGTGFGTGTTATAVGPLTLRNVSATELDPVGVANNAPTANTSFVPRAFETTYYSTPALTQSNNAGVVSPVVGGTVNQLVRVGGQEATYFSSIANLKLVQIQVVLIPTQDLGSAKAKGVNVENVDEVVKFFKL